MYNLIKFAFLTLIICTIGCINKNNKVYSVTIKRTFKNGFPHEKASVETEKLNFETWVVGTIHFDKNQRPSLSKNGYAEFSNPDFSVKAQSMVHHLTYTVKSAKKFTDLDIKSSIHQAVLGWKYVDSLNHIPKKHI